MVGDIIRRVILTANSKVVWLSGKKTPYDILFHIPPGLIEDAGYHLQTPVREQDPGLQGRTPRSRISLWGGPNI